MQNGLLYKTCTYLSSSMENAECDEWRSKCLSFFKDIGVKVFDPYNKPFMDDLDESPEFRKKIYEEREKGNLEWVHEHFRNIRAVDLSCCDRADFLTVHIYPKIASWGAAEEIYTANRAKKPIFITVEGGIKKTPLWLLGVLPPKYFYNNVDEMLEMIYNINHRIMPIDSRRWKLLKPELR